MSYDSAPPPYGSSRSPTGIINFSRPTFPQSQPTNYGTLDSGYPPIDPPPSYESLYGEFREIRSPGSFANFLTKSCRICCKSIVAVIFVVVSTSIPISMIVIGSKYLYDCEAERYIPIFLIVGGSVLLLQSLLDLVSRIKLRRSDGEENERSSRGVCQGLLTFFFMCWFIAGNVWVYRIYIPEFHDPTSNRYCAPTLYWFAFSVVTVIYGFFCFFLTMLCWCGCFLMCLSMF